jgi:hypothetical protein
MTRTAHTAAARHTTSPVRAPRRQRLGAAVASAVVTGCVFGSIVLGMTSTGDAGPAVVAQARTAHHA